MNTKLIDRVSIVSFIFVAVYALFGIVLVAFFETDFINELLAPVKIFHLVLPFLAIIVCFSWPFFGLIAIGTLIAKIVFYVRGKVSKKEKYIREIILHAVFSVVGMIGIYAMYYDKFGNPFRG